MKAVKKSLLLRRITPLIIIVYCMLSSGCSTVRDNNSTKVDLNAVIESISGKDAFAFEGAATLLRGAEPLPESLLYYGGKVTDHTKLSLYSLLPDSSLSKSSVNSNSRDLKNNSSSVQPYYSQLEKKAGKWELQATAESSQEVNPLPALNPLAQLEKLEGMEINVTEEVGAGRGTRVLRFNLTSVEARNQLSDELEREMLALRPEGLNKTEKSSENELELTNAMFELWQKKNDQLQQKLEQAKIEAIYYLTVDKKDNLPRRLTLNRKVSYPSETNKLASETYVTQVDFYYFH